MTAMRSSELSMSARRRAWLLRRAASALARARSRSMRSKQRSRVAHSSLGSNGLVR